MKEATARIKINKLLESAGWRFFADDKGPANIQLEPSVTLKQKDLEGLGADFEKAKKGFIDFLLLNEKGFPFIVLEAKSEDKNPLVGKEQAREYAKSQKCRFVLLSNGNMHYFWDLEQGSPHLITTFPTPASVAGYQKILPMPKRLITEVVDDDFVVLTQRPDYQSEAGWKNLSERPRYIELHGLRFLRPYQKKAIHVIQQKLDAGMTRFLLEMATGTGKTLTAAAIIKLFLKTRNAQRVLFLVDRLELEEQAWKAFRKVLSNDFKTVIYKESREEWRGAEIVVSTVQSLLFDNKFQRLFSPTDFDLVISDEAHRSIGGNARAVFDYFIGYKLGLTATPRDYLKNLDRAESHRKDPREYERRLMLDTYRTFGCEDGQPTFRYSLLNGVKDGFLINPTVVDCRTEVTTQLLSDSGFIVDAKDDEGEGEEQQTYRIRQFEKKFFSKATNQLFCKTFLENALRDPVSGEMGKSIVFAVSQHHAAKLAQILNEMADVIWPGRYQSDFAVQVTSHVTSAQQFTINFTNNIIVPEGIIFQGQTAYKELRKMLVENSLVAVVSLPAGCFNPYSGVKTSILILDKSLAKQSDTIAFFKVENDGFGLGAQRRSIEKNDLPQVQAELEAYLHSLRMGVPCEALAEKGQIVPKEKIAANGDYNLSGERYREGDAVNQKWPMVELGTVARLINGRAYKQEELLTEGPVPVLRVGNFFSNRGWYYSDLELEPDKYCNPGDLLFAWSASFGPRIWDGPRAIYHYHIWKVEPTEAIDKMFLFHLLASEAEKIKSEGNGIAMVHATKGGMEVRKFPLPPLEVQKEIVAEIEGYQKVIDGARAVLDNYRPHIPIHPDWAMSDTSGIFTNWAGGT